MRVPVTDLLESKKFLTYVTTIAVALGAKWGIDLDDKIVAAIIGLGAMLIFGQGLQDHGVEAAKVQSSQPPKEIP